jgi:ATP-dependent Lon protease
LSKVLFVATANMIDNIPGPLRDRLEIITIPGYTEEEKLHIAKDYLVHEQGEAHGLKMNKDNPQFVMNDAALRKVIGNYTREAGVRSLKREIASIARGVAKDVAVGKIMKAIVGEAEVETYLGQEKYILDVAERTAKTGIATGLAWTPVGGDILFIEATRMKGKGGMLMTGQLGDVMKESAKAAESWIRSMSVPLGIPDSAFTDFDYHVHVPAGAIPKDGPSAGVTMLTALSSLILGRAMDPTVAMTGEITLRGAVLPVGGIKEKVLAAHRAGIKTVIMCERNKKDLEDIPEDLRKAMSFIFVKEMAEVLKVALGVELNHTLPLASDVPAAGSVQKKEEKAAPKQKT